MRGNVEYLEDYVSHPALIRDFLKNTRHFWADQVSGDLPVDGSICCPHGLSGALRGNFKLLFASGVGAVPAVPLPLALRLGADFLPVSGPGLRGEPPSADAAPFPQATLGRGGGLLQVSRGWTGLGGR